MKRASVAAEWAYFFKKAVITDENDTAEAIAAWRAMFYAGAKGCLNLITKAPDPNAMIEALRKELDDYGEETRRTGRLQ